MAKNPKPARSVEASDARPQIKSSSRSVGASSARPQTKAAPKKRNQEAAAEEATTGNILWRLALVFCTALVIIALVFASINGGSDLVGAPAKTSNTTPTPPAATADPNQTVTGSDATPIPPSPTPEVTPEVE